MKFDAGVPTDGHVFGPQRNPLDLLPAQLDDHFRLPFRFGRWCGFGGGGRIGYRRSLSGSGCRRRWSRGGLWRKEFLRAVLLSFSTRVGRKKIII